MKTLGQEAVRLNLSYGKKAPVARQMAMLERELRLLPREVGGQVRYCWS